MLQTLLLLGDPGVFMLKALLPLSDLLYGRAGIWSERFHMAAMCNLKFCLGPASQPAAEVCKHYYYSNQGVVHAESTNTTQLWKFF